MSDLCKSPNRDIAKHCPGIELNCQSLDIEERFCYLGTQQMLEGVKMIVLYQGSGVDGLKRDFKKKITGKSGMRQGCLDGCAMLVLRPAVHRFHYVLAFLSVWCVLFIMPCSFFITWHACLILLFPFFLLCSTHVFIKCYALFIIQ